MQEGKVEVFVIDEEMLMITSASGTRFISKECYDAYRSAERSRLDAAGH